MSATVHHDHDSNRTSALSEARRPHTTAIRRMGSKISYLQRRSMPCCSSSPVPRPGKPQPQIGHFIFVSRRPGKQIVAASVRRWGVFRMDLDHLEDRPKRNAARHVNVLHPALPYVALICADFVQVLRVCVSNPADRLHTFEVF